MANDFAIRISAIDAASATINKINAAFSRFTRPVRATQEAFAKLGKETGLDSLAKSLTKAGSAAASVVDRLGSVQSSIGTLAGVGTVGGLALLTRQWADMGNAATNAAYRIGIGAGQLGRFQSAARLAGVSGEAATAGASAMAKNIGDVLSGRNPTMAGYFAQLGIRARYDANGQADVAGAYRDLARALERAPTVQGKNAILAALGQPEEIRRLVEQMDDLGRSAAEMRPNLGAAADAGTALHRSMTKLGENVTGLGENIELILAPGLKVVVDWLGKVAEWANKATQALGPLAHLFTIGAGVVGGAAAGAAGGAAIGALGGPFGVGAGALGGAIAGGIGGGITAAGVDAMGHTGSAGIRRNNPGNLRQPGGIGFQSFPTPEDGLTAAARNLLAYRNKHHLNTIAEIVRRWAPPNENDTTGYILGVSDQTGIRPGAQLPNDTATNAAILGAIVKREQGRQPFTPEQLAGAIAAAQGGGGGTASKGGEVHVTVNAPAGSTVTATSSQNWPVRVHYSMPTGATNP